MSGALVALILIFIGVLLAGRHVRKPGPRSYLFIIVMTMIQVGVVLLYIFTAEPPPQ